jgi:hypothetical protein
MTAPSEPSSVQHVRGRMRWGHLALLTVLLLSGGATRALAGDSA